MGALQVSSPTHPPGVRLTEGPPAAKKSGGAAAREDSKDDASPSVPSRLLPASLPSPSPDRHQRNTKGATSEIWPLTTPLGKGTSGLACLTPVGSPRVLWRRLAPRGRSAISGACLTKIPRHSQVFF